MLNCTDDRKRTQQRRYVMLDPLERVMWYIETHMLNGKKKTRLWRVEWSAGGKEESSGGKETV